MVSHPPPTKKTKSIIPTPPEKKADCHCSKLLPPSCGAKSAKSAATRGAKKCPSSVPQSLSYGLSKVITPQSKTTRFLVNWHGFFFSDDACGLSLGNPYDFV